MSKFEEPSPSLSVKLPNLDLDSTTLPTDIVQKQDTEVNAETNETTLKQIAEDPTCKFSVASSGITQELEKIETATNASQTIAAKNLVQELDGDLKVWLNWTIYSTELIDQHMFMKVDRTSLGSLARGN